MPQGHKAFPCPDREMKSCDGVKQGKDISDEDNDRFDMTWASCYSDNEVEAHEEQAELICCELVAQEEALKAITMEQDEQADFSNKESDLFGLVEAGAFDEESDDHEALESGTICSELTHRKDETHDTVATPSIDATRNNEKELHRRASNAIDRQVTVLSEMHAISATQDQDIQLGRGHVDGVNFFELTRFPSLGQVRETSVLSPIACKGGVIVGQRAPGVEFVRTRAPGMRPAWVIQHIRREAQRRAQEHAQQSDEEAVTSAPCSPLPALEESAPAPLKRRSKVRYWLTFILVCLLAGAILGGILGTRRPSHAKVSITRWAPFTSDCSNLFGQLQPNVIAQCHCHGSITKVAKDVMTRYVMLSETFMPSTFPDFHDSVDSCSPRNQALLWLASGDGQANESSIRQRYLLAVLYISWNGPHRVASSGWLSAEDECTWSGVTCNGSNQVVKIDLPGRKLNGNIGSDVSFLTSLTSLSLDQNNFQGTLPTELARLSNLAELSVSFNTLTGNIPSEYDKLTQLTSLVLSNNYLVGSLSTELGMLSGLQTLRLSNNAIEGRIPTEFGMLHSIQSIGLDNNTLTGALPTEIGLWQNAQLIDVSFNMLSGSTIPSEIGLITTLKKVLLLDCGIQGTLPDVLFGILGLKEIIVTQNHLHGTISTLVGQLTSLTNLFLGDNLFTGSIPSELGKCTDLTDVYVNDNLLNGTIPTSIGMLARLNTLDLRGNQTFTGTVSTEICAVVTPLFCYHGYRSNLQCNCCNCPGGAFERPGL